MAETTEISWAHSTFNPWLGCTRVSPGCDNCYAATLMDERYHRVKWGAGEVRQRTKTWHQPRQWERAAAASGDTWRVFCGSLCDVFDNEVPAAWRLELGHLIWTTPHLTWMLLTKRIGNMAAALRDFNWAHFPSNVWLGITVVNQDEADRDIPKLLQAPVRGLRWLSCEPLLSPLDLTALPFRDHRQGFSQNVLTGEATIPASGVNGHPDIVVRSEPGLMRRIDWVIVGGESGAAARAIEPDWARAVRDQCSDAKVPFHFKQWGGIRPKSNGYLLDGIEHRAFPRDPLRGWK